MKWLFVIWRCKLGQIEQIWVIFSHLKLWVAAARHNFKWVKNEMINLEL